MIDNPTLQFFGCSFTSLETSDTHHVFTNFRNRVSEKTKYFSVNHSKTGKSNEQIIDDVYTHYSDSINRGSICIIQFSFNDRIGMYSDMEDEFVSMCKTTNADSYKESIFIDFYNNWLKYFYSRKNRALEFIKQVDFVCTWLRSHNVKFICFGMDKDMDEKYYTASFYQRNNFIKFENTYSLYGYACMNKLRIADMPEYQKAGLPTDYHLNNDGHIYIGNKLLEKMKNKKFY